MRVYTAALYIIDALKIDDIATVTNLSLNKLLYFAQGHYLAQTGELLFEDDVEAWNYGPVVPTVYHWCKAFGSAPIICVDDMRIEEPDKFETAVLNDVIREYGKYSASYLVALSHADGSPWSLVKLNDVIPPELMLDYFTKHPLEISDDEMEADCIRFDEIMDSFSEDDYISEDDAFGL